MSRQTEPSPSARSRLHERSKEIFHAAVILPPEDREAWLREHCDGDESLLLEVLSLLRHHDDRPLLPGADAVVRKLAQACHDAALMHGDVAAHRVGTASRIRKPRGPPT